MKKTSKKTTKKVETKKELKQKETISLETKKTIIAGILLIIVLVAGFFLYQYKQDELEKDKVIEVEITEDEKNFKEEYESLNGTIRSTGIENKTIEIPEDNNVEYITMQEAADILSSGSGVVYFGFAACPWCRNLTPILINTIKTTNLDKIYYVNVKPDDDSRKDLRGQFKVENKKVVVDVPAADGYYQVLEKLDEYLNDYKITDKVTNKKYDTNVKRLGAPTVVAVKNGEIVGYHVGTLDGHVKDESGVLPDLTKEQEEIVSQSILKLVQNYLSDSCSSDEENQTSC